MWLDRIVECVPNFSEGRRQSVIQALIRSVRSVEGVHFLDRHMDSDHHRAVLTLVGAPDGMAEAAFRLVRQASDLIDLRGHEGGHPRIGAADVVPFVPVRGLSMGDCVSLARQVGERIGRELEIPVFLYEEAATRPERVRLEAIRRGGPQGLAERMRTEPSWRPDFGPEGLHPTAGAVALCARRFLIAFNVYLAAEDPRIARAIARRVRESDGGLRAVKALGVALPSRGLVQVSMNLTNFRETSIKTAFDAVREEADLMGVRIHGSQFVGLVPEEALSGISPAEIGLIEVKPEQVLEVRMDQVMG